MSGTIRLARAEAEWLFRGALAATSDQDVTPIICAVKLTVKNDRVTAIATDRYRVHQLFVPVAPGAPDGEFVMSRRQVQRLLKSWHGSRSLFPDQVVDIAWEDRDPNATTKVGMPVTPKHTGWVEFTVLSDLTDAAELISHGAPQVRGPYPPVERLFPDDPSDQSTEPVSQMFLDPAFLADTRYLRSGQGSLRFVVPRAGAKGSHQAFLVVNTEGTARALIQPQRPARDWEVYGDA
ncbi:hypothetical protein [Agrococcus casei]|uniref:Uncharacterized protein n=1 Tax=Agrococcus casei LMG 22410 TaxID=1255656 RepID=A0A1R4FG12_9MICO|nr:hypothetical protein [Agrococcus casei]SJM54874.1 hypothetical protein CZ674_04360 [Agrococcus casei LMG 22410]